jgi:hypothetical protein
MSGSTFVYQLFDEGLRLKSGFCFFLEKIQSRNTLVKIFVVKFPGYFNLFSPIVYS